MKKFLVFILTIVVLGGGGYYAYKHFFQDEPQVATAEPKEEPTLQADEQKKVDKEDIIPTEQGVPTNKVWEFSFDRELDAGTVNDTNITIVDSKGKKASIQTELISGNKILKINPPSEGYKKGTTYKLHIENGISYKQGEPVSKPYDLVFITERDKVEKITYNPNLIKVKEDQIEVLNDNEIKVNKDVKKDLKVGDILIIPSDTNEDGKALKVKKVKTNLNSYTATVVKPSFPELFEELNIYNTYELKPENITLEPGIEGLTVEPIAQVKPNTLIASTLKPRNKGEYGLPTIESKISKSNGFTFGFKDLKVGKEDSKVVLDGSIHMLNPEVHTDIDLGMLKVDKFLFSSNLHTEENVKLRTVKFDKEDAGKVLNGTDLGENLKSFKNEVDSTNRDIKKAINKKIKERIKIATVKVPLPEPGIFVEGKIMLDLKYDAKGEQQVSITLETDDEKGIQYENGHTQIISNFEPKVDIAYQGNAHASAQLGPKIDLGITAFDVFGGGVSGLAAAKVSGDFAFGSYLTKQNSFACADASISGIAEGSVYLDKGIPFLKGDNYIFEYVFAQKEFMKHSIETCNAFEKINTNYSQLKIASNDTATIKVYEDTLNLLSQTHSNKNVDYKKLKVKVKDKNVIQVLNSKEGLKVKTPKIPTKEKTELTLTYTKTDELFKKDKTVSVTIPVTITNYDKVKEEEKKAKEKKQEETKKQNDSINLSSLNGTWSRNIHHQEGTLVISNATKSSFDFTIDTLYGANTGYAEGKATISGNKASYVDSEFGCRLTFDLGQNAINIKGNHECLQLGGINTSFDGKYDKGAATPEVKSLYQLGVLPAKDDEKVKKLVGQDYNTLVDNMQIVSTDEDRDNLGATVISGGVQGLYTIKESIIQYDANGYYYVALIVDDSRVKYYTNNPSFKGILTDTINNWMTRFNTYPVETNFKDI
ncbi:Ig-like domain-containing protein [Priestia filamentosa]|uniref:Ig-like domain-containing protein n=1 Tax=Priestia filamentosa TaxID=1402861 RepID=UPI00397D4933